MGAAMMSEHEELTVPRRASARAVAARPGITLVEIMVAMTIMTIGVLGMVGAFKFFNVGVQSAKTRSLANNIAQERIEFLKNKSYYRVLVTTATADDPNFPAGEMTYDVAPNGEEAVNVGGITFKRRVYVRKVNERTSDKGLDYLAWNEADTGLKEIKVYVTWFERGEWRKLEIRNLRDNPARVNKDCTISGTVTSGGSPLAGVVVRAQEAPSYYAETGANGNYSFSIVPGTYTLQASKEFYFPSVLPSFGLPSGTDVTGKNFALTAMDSVRIYGYAFVRDRLAISSIAGSTVTATGDNEWIEVYNPTTWTWTMATGLGTGANEEVVVSYKQPGNPEVKPDFNYRTTTLSPGRYYLFANTGTVTAAGVTRQADAVWDSDGDWDHQDDVIESGSPSPAAYVILGKKSSGQILDKVGWSSSGHGSKKQPESYEGWGPIQYDNIYGWNTNTGGLEPDSVFVRNTWFWYIYPNEASCSDTDQNVYDFWISSRPLAFPPRNSTVAQTCMTGWAANGGIVFADDGLSSPASVDWYGYYELNPVSTGTWTVYMSSGVVYSSVAYYGGTSPGTWYYSGYNVLSTTTIYGYVTGRVTNVLGAALPNIKMFSPGSSPVYTNASGRYTLPVEAGVVNVMANYQSYSPSYVELSSADIVVDVGEVQQGVDFALYQGGRIRGKVTTNGVDPLPNIPVVGFKGGVEQGSGISGSDGYFMISGTGISTGTYVVVPQLEAGESASPSSTTVTVTAGVTAFSSTYTVSNAYGYVTGSVTKSGTAITTGVMVYVTTATLAAAADPPDITPALRGSTGVYYAASSSALGTYTIPVKGGYTYNIYAWYTTWSSGANPVPTTTRQSATGVVVSPNTTVTRNLAW